MYIKIVKDGVTFFGQPLNVTDYEYNLKEIFSDREIVIDKNAKNDLTESQFNFFDGGVFEKVYNFLKNDNSYFDLKEKIKIVSESDDIYENFLKNYNLKILSCSGVTDISFLHSKILEKIDEYKEKFLNELSDISSQEELSDEIEILKTDLEKNINDFKKDYLPQITFDNFSEFWPTLLNPSPYLLYLA